MSTKQQRKVMNTFNDNLRADNYKLRSRQNQLLSHIQTLIKREKQLTLLKQQYLQQSLKAQNLALRQKTQKQQKCLHLQSQIAQINRQMQQTNSVLAALQLEYQHCLNDYDQILAQVSELIENNKIIQLQLTQQNDKKATFQTVIFDYERLQRVLQQQKNYFKSLATNSQKSHLQKMKQLIAIKQKLISQEKQSQIQSSVDRIQIGYKKISNLLTKKIKQHTSYFIRGFYKFQKLTQLGVKKFQNCLKIAQTRYKNQLKKTFTKWNKNAFPIVKMSNIVENSLTLNFESRRKIQTLNKIIEKVNFDNLSLLHLYQRTKILCLTATSLKKKEIHLAFTRWRQQSNRITSVKYGLERMIQKFSIYSIRNSFSQLKQNLHLQKRFQVASHLLSQYQNTKGMAWAMRKWRWQVANTEIKVIERFVENMKNNSLIQQRVKYEKRKLKALTSLQLSISKIQMRNYFHQYYQNSKISKIYEIDSNIQITRQKCSQSRKQNKSTAQYFQTKNTTLTINKIFQSVKKIASRDLLYTLKSIYQLQNGRKSALLIVLLKKEGKNKYYALNQFRKNVQFHQKKQMHQVLTDLNRKMEQINQKSTIFRNSLKQTIQFLGLQSSKNINQISQHILNAQQKSFFHFYSRKKIQNLFRSTIILKTLLILQSYTKNNVFKVIQNFSRDQHKQKLLSIRETQFIQKRSNNNIQKAFRILLNSLITHKKAFSKLIHVQNVMYFYRLEAAFLQIKKKSHYQTLKLKEKQTNELKKIHSNKFQNLEKLKSQEYNLQQKLKNLFVRFINFQDISQRNKQNTYQQSQKKKYFQIYRKKVQKFKYASKVLDNFVKLLEYKNYFIFWKSILMINYQNRQVGIRQELGKINKKRKTFDDKILKTNSDVERDLNQKEEIYYSKMNEARYYLDKYNKILSFCDRKNKLSQQKRYLKQIFKVWKRQSLGAKKIHALLQKILKRTNFIEPCQRLWQQFKKHDSQIKGKSILKSLFENKYKMHLKDGFNLWRFNIKHSYCNTLRYRIDNIDDHHNQIRNETQIKAQLFANQVIRNKKYDQNVIIFMALKNNWIQAKQMNKKIQPFFKKLEQRRKFNAMKCWKWLAFYKKTKRSFLNHKLSIYKKNLKKDVFTSLKIYREQLYNFVYLAENFIINRIHDLKKSSFKKMINFASFQKNELIYTRRRKIHELIMNKIAKQKIIKRTVLWKWQSQLIPRKHYLCNVLKKIQLRILKSALANINEKKYWNEFYIKGIAQKVTTQGYSDVNSVTNILMKEGFDPDELKSYLQKKNEKDTKIIKQVIAHMKALPNKKKMIEAFHSWKEYVALRKNIKKTLSKVFNFSTGVGRYFNRWRKKDPIFNEILQRQSRQNMLQRYYELERLMKEYRRDIKNSVQNCEQLKQINDQYAKSTKMTVQVAFSNLATSVHKGMKQGFQLWRINAKQKRILQTNNRYDQIVDGIQMLDQEKRKILQKIRLLQNQNLQLKQKCKWGEQCGELLKKLILQKDGLSVNLAQKQHNLKILLQDNLRLKQKIKTAQTSALKLINKIRSQQN